MTSSSGTRVWSDRINREISAAVPRLAWFVERTSQWDKWSAGFCEAIQIEAVHGLASYGTWASSGYSTSAWLGYPWLTFVMGSGPLGLPSQIAADEGKIPNDVAAALVKGWTVGSSAIDFDFDLQDREAGAAHSVLEFTRSVLEGRLHPEDNGPLVVRDAQKLVDLNELRSRAADTPFSSFTARLALFAAELTRAYHWLSQYDARPTGRWGDDTARLATADASFPYFEDRFGRGLRRLASELTTSRSQVLEPDNSVDYDQGFFGALNTVLKGIGERLPAGPDDVVDIGLGDLQLVNDCFWYCLLREVAPHHYPGWTDLLVRLVLKTQGDGPGSRLKAHKPSGRLEDLEKQIYEVMNGPAEKSWTGGAVLGERATRHYLAVARTLWAQSDCAALEAAASTPGPTRRATNVRPVAFVTSLDSELEKALWTTAEEGRSAGDQPRTFSVVIPAYFVHTRPNNDLGEPLWLERLVTVDPTRVAPEDRLHATFGTGRVKGAKKGPWRIMRGGRTNDELPRHPVIVRLTGCPFFPLPKLQELIEDKVNNAQFYQDWREIHGGTDQPGGDRSPISGQFHHAVTIDEYLALRQSIAESHWSAYTMSNKGQTHGDPSRGLPKDLLVSESDGPTRVWMLMGVPIHDSAVRIRVLTTMSSAAWSDAIESAGLQGRSGPGPTRADSARTAAPVRSDEASAQVGGMPAPSGEMPAPSGGMPAPSGGMPAPASTREMPPRAPTRGMPAPLESDDEVREIEEAVPDQPPDRLRGLVVNVHLGDDEIGLMSSLGLRVIRERCEEFTDDIDHYSQHLRAGTRPEIGCHEARMTDQRPGGRSA